MPYERIDPIGSDRRAVEALLGPARLTPIEREHERRRREEEREKRRRRAAGAPPPPAPAADDDDGRPHIDVRG